MRRYSNDLETERKFAELTTMGYAFFFEGLVVYGETSQCLITLFRSRNLRKRAGEFLGAVKTIIPTNPYRILYEYLKHDINFKRREWFRKRKTIRAEKRSLDTFRRNAFQYDGSIHRKVRVSSYEKQQKLA